MDLLTVNSLKFLSTVSHDIYNCTAQMSANQLLQSIKFLDEVFGIYKHGGFELTEVHCDNKFHKVMDNYSIKQYPLIQMNYAVVKAHVPCAEKNNRTIQECVCEMFYTHLPHILVKIPGNSGSTKINFFPKQAWHLQILQPSDDSPSRKYRLQLPLQACTWRLCTIHMMTKTPKLQKYHAHLMGCTFVPPGANKRVVISHNSGLIMSS